jgi:hypothetical protein
MSQKQTPELDIANPPPGFSLSEVADLLLQGHRPAHIKQRLLAEGVSNDNADEIVWCAFDHIVTDAASMDCNTNKAWLVAAGRMVFRKQLDAGDHAGCVSTLKALASFKLPSPLPDDEFTQDPT